MAEAYGAPINNTGEPMKKLRPLVRTTVFVLGLLLLAASVVCTPAQATLIELEPDLFRVGTNVSNLFEGVTLNRYSNYYTDTPTLSPVFIEEHGAGELYQAATGTHTFGIFYFDGVSVARNWWSTGVGRDEKFWALLIQFDRPTNFVEIAASWASDGPYFLAFDSNRQMITTPTSSSLLRADDGRHGPAAIFHIGSLASEPMIQSMLIGGGNGNSNIDTIWFNSGSSVGVPEPSSMLMLGVGLVGLMLWRRKQAA